MAPNRSGEPSGCVATESGRPERRCCTRHACLGLPFARVAAAAPRRVGVPGDVDLELGLEGRDALVEVIAGVDVLAVAEQRALRLLALHLAPALELCGATTLAAHLAVDVGLRGTAAVTARFALRVAAGGGGRAVHFASHEPLQFALHRPRIARRRSSKSMSRRSRRSSSRYSFRCNRRSPGRPCIDPSKRPHSSPSRTRRRARCTCRNTERRTRRRSSPACTAPRSHPRPGSGNWRWPSRRCRRSRPTGVRRRCEDRSRKGEDTKKQRSE